MDVDAVGVGVFYRLFQVLIIEILCLGTEAEGLSADIYRIGAVAHRGFQDLQTPRGNQKLRFLSLFCTHHSFLTLTARPSPKGSTAVDQMSRWVSSHRYSRILVWMVRSLRSTA